MKNQIEKNKRKIIIRAIERRRSQQILKIKTNSIVESSITFDPKGRVQERIPELIHQNEHNKANDHIDYES